MNVVLYSSKPIPPAVIEKLDPREALMIEKSQTTPFSEQTDQELIRSIEEVLGYIFHDIGIHQKPSQYEATRFMQIVRRYFNMLTMGEIKLAFEFLVMGDLDYYLPKDRSGRAERNHFQMFSLEYVSRILKAYITMKSSVVMKVRILSLPEHKIDPIVVRTEFRKLMDQELIRYRETGEIEFASYYTALDFLKEVGIYSGVFEISDEDRLEGLHILDQIGQPKTAGSVQVYGQAYRAKEIVKEVFSTLDETFKFLPDEV